MVTISTETADERCVGNRLGGLFEWLLGRAPQPLAGPDDADALAGGDSADTPPCRRSIERNAARRAETLRWVTSDGNDGFAAVQVEDNSDFGVRVHSPAALAVGETVWLTFHGDVEKCVVRHCAATNGGFVVGLYRVRQERRREDRYVVEGKADLFWSGLGTDSRHVEVEVRDVSAAGMQLLTLHPVPVQTAVRVSGQDYACLGVTCYCRPDGERFAVGVQFTQDPYYREGAEYDD